MVLQQTHRRPRVAHQRLDLSRILGISSTLALNVLAMLALLIPMNLPAPIALPDPDPQLFWIDDEPRPKPQPVKVEVVRPQPVLPQPVRARTVEPPVADVPVLVENGSLQADPVVEATVSDFGPPDIAPSTPVAGVRLEYASAPAPDYPRDAIRRNLQGTVMLQVLVDVDGKPLEVTVQRSSGHGVLDREAVRHVMRNWTFRPAMKDGRAVQATGIVPIDFRLDRM